MADLERFVRAQDPVFGEVLAELRRGRKDGHWMWFVFPQVQGLGYSERARFYALSSLEEARAYLRHPVLGLRLRECTRLVVDIAGSISRGDLRPHRRAEVPIVDDAIREGDRRQCVIPAGTCEVLQREVG